MANPDLENRSFETLPEYSPACAKSCFLSGVALVDNVPYATGGFTDTWKGQQDGNQVCVKAFRTQTQVHLDKIKRVGGSSPFRSGGLDLIPIRGSIMRLWGGNTCHIQTSYPSSGFRRRCSRSASSVLGCQVETFSSTSGDIGGSIGYIW